VAASGGYYIACAADMIVANPGTLTGSIGVILSFPTGQKLLDKIGLEWETVKSGELKDVGSFDRAMTEKEEIMLKGVIDDTYEQFVNAVAEGLDRPVDEIYRYADGSIFTGLMAYNFGLIDTLGTFEDAVTMAGELAGIGSDPDTIRERKRKPGIWDILGNFSQIIEKISELENGQPMLQYLYR
jgi:protease-4